MTPKQHAAKQEAEQLIKDCLNDVPTGLTVSRFILVMKAKDIVNEKIKHLESVKANLK